MRRAVFVVGVVLWAVGSAVAWAQAPGAPPPRAVRAILAEARVPDAGLAADVLDTLALDFAVEQGAESTTIAYRVATVSGQPRLEIRRRDNARGEWRHAAHDDPAIVRGSVAQVMSAHDWTLVDTERGDLLGDLLVLDRALAVRARLDGLLVGVLPDGSLLYRENQEGLRPARPLALSIYEPDEDRRSRIYPPDAPPATTRQHFADRARRVFAGWGLQKCLALGHPCNAEQFDAFVVSEVRADGRGHRFGWIVRFGPAEGDTGGPAGYTAYVVVACDRPEGMSAATCRERPFGQYDGPDGPNTQAALAVALTRRGERQP